MLADGRQRNYHEGKNWHKIKFRQLECGQAEPRRVFDHLKIDKEQYINQRFFGECKS